MYPTLSMGVGCPVEHDHGAGAAACSLQLRLRGRPLALLRQRPHNCHAKCMPAAVAWQWALV